MQKVTSRGDAPSARAASGASYTMPEPDAGSTFAPNTALAIGVPPEAASAEPSPASDPAAEVAESPTTEEQSAAPRGPFPPPKAFRPTRPGTPRNPRR